MKGLKKWRMLVAAVAAVLTLAADAGILGRDVQRAVGDVLDRLAVPVSEVGP